MRSMMRVACAQVIYAQAERLAERASGKSSKTPAPVTSPAKPPQRRNAAATDPVPASAVYASESFADALVDVMSAFIQHVGSASRAVANHGNRTHVVLPDLLAVLDEMAPTTHSHTRDLARYSMLEEIRFPTSVPEFPASFPVPDGPTDNHMDVGPEDLTKATPTCVESWMPPLPPARTYIATPGVLKQNNSNGTASSAPSGRRMVERSLARLKNQPAEFVNAGDALAANPFLAPPRVGTAPILDEDVAGPPRDPIEPPDNDLLMTIDTAMRDSNVPQMGGLGDVSSEPVDAGNVGTTETSSKDPKRARVMRILQESRGVGTGSAAASGTVGAATETNAKTATEPKKTPAAASRDRPVTATSATSRDPNANPKKPSSSPT